MVGLYSRGAKARHGAMATRLIVLAGVAKDRDVDNLSEAPVLIKGDDTV